MDSQGSCWTAAYPNEGGNVVRDLRANIAAEAGARQTYEALIKACDDEGTKKTLTHLLTREITHANMFMKALDSMGKLDDPMFGNIPPDDTVKLVFNLSHCRSSAVDAAARLVLLADDVPPLRRATGRVLAWIQHSPSALAGSRPDP
jgi:Mn-containing catalase